MEELKTIETSVKAATEAVQEMKKANEAAIGEVKTSVENLATEVKNVKENAAKNQEAIDSLVAGAAKKSVNTEKKSFGEAFNEALQEAWNTDSQRKALEAMSKGDKHAKLVLDLKLVGTMTNSASLTGDAVASYSSRQGLVPSQKVNFRDLVPSVTSPTGIYVHYRETGTDGAFSVQTEGNAKGQIDYDLTEVKTVSDYIAGYARFSKQLAFNLPFLQNSLQRMLLRDFYKKENATFFTAMTSATGSTTTSATVDAEQLVDWIANQLAADFTPSFVLVHPSQWARLLKTKPSDYSIPGGMVIDAMGNIRICGVPVIGASWVTDDKALIVDSDFVERVETEGLRFELSYEDSDNFTKNLVTARIECFEDLNLIRTDAHIYADFGNAS